MNNKGKIVLGLLGVCIIVFSFMFFTKNTDFEELAPTPPFNDTLIMYGFEKDDASIIREKVSEENINYMLQILLEIEYVNEMVNDKCYVDENLKEYLEYSNRFKDKELRDVIMDVNSNINREFYTGIVNTTLEDGLLIINNKYYVLSIDFYGFNLVDLESKYSTYGKVEKLNKDTRDALVNMINDMNKFDLDISVYSAYRSYETQNKLYNNYIARDGKKEADTYSARPGHSEHQTGLAIDVKSDTMNTWDFDKTKEYTWMFENAHKYGFILRYPKGMEYITGYQYEPWHWRYVGVKEATYIYENNMIFEEYYEVFVK